MPAIKYTDDYLEFYEAYPRHEGKAEGQKAWDRLDMIDRKAALADVEKRNRHKAWSADLRRVQMPGPFLNQRRWEDDWLSTLETRNRDDDKTHRTPTKEYKPVDAGPELPWPEQMIHRNGMYYIMCAGKSITDDCDGMRAIKREIIRDVVPALKDEIDAEQNDMARRRLVHDHALTILRLFLDRCDKHYGLDIAARAEAMARRQRMAA